MTISEQISLVALRDRAATTAPPTLQWSDVEPAVTISTCLELDQALRKVALHTTPPGRPLSSPVQARRSIAEGYGRHAIKVLAGFIVERDTVCG